MQYNNVSYSIKTLTHLNNELLYMVYMVLYINIIGKNILNNFDLKMPAIKNR